MLILKGRAGKSVILEHIYKSTNSLAFVYYEQPVIDGALWVGMKSIQFDDFMRQIPKYLDKNERNNRYDYLIIYTNETEEDIKSKRRLIEEIQMVMLSFLLPACTTILLRPSVLGNIP